MPSNDSGDDSSPGSSSPSDSAQSNDPASSTPESSPPSDPSPPNNAAPPSDPSPPTNNASPAEPPPSDDSRSFVERIGDGWERATEHLALAVIPLLSSLLAVDNVRRVHEFRGAHFGLAFRFPSALPDLWTFVSLPNQGTGVHVSPTLFLTPVLVVVQAVLVAGLLGSVHEVLTAGGRRPRRTGRTEQTGQTEQTNQTGQTNRTEQTVQVGQTEQATEYDFSANARRYFVPVLIFVVLVRIVGLAAVSVGAVALPLVLLLVPLFLLLSYVFYATPYLLVVADMGVGDALGRSYEWALAGGPYLSYGAGYLLFVTAVSLVATAFVVNLGAVGVALGALLSAPIALALTFATTEFVAELADSAELTDPWRWE